MGIKVGQQVEVDAWRILNGVWEWWDIFLHPLNPRSFGHEDIYLDDFGSY
jgi:hypothetical protein